MKKIYIISLHLRHGGIEKVVCNLSNLFVEMNYDVEILCTYFYEEPVYYLDNRVKITYLKYELPKKTTSLKKSLKNLDFMRFINDLYTRYNQYYLHNKAVEKSIKNINNSIIISTRNEHNKLINKHSKNSNKLIAQLHCDHTQFKGYLRDIKYRYSNIDYLLLLTEDLKNEVETELIGINWKTKCLTVPNFIKIKKKIKILERKKQVISVGRLSIEKGFDRLLLIWSKFIINNEGYKLKIVGDGEERENLIQLTRSLNISDSVIFTGFLSNDKTLKEIKESKIYVMTSLYEALPMVLLESISKGTPIVAYDIRVGPRSVIKEGYNGFLIKENDIEGFIKKMDVLIKDNSIYRNMSNNAITSSVLYSEEKLKDIWFSILN